MHYKQRLPNIARLAHPHKGGGDIRRGYILSVYKEGARKEVVHNAISMFSTVLKPHTLFIAFPQIVVCALVQVKLHLEDINGKLIKMPRK